MARRRGASGLSGIVLVDKPGGMSSHDVVDRIRRLTGEGRVGHAGTLDPMATGLLVVLVGPATRLSDYLMGHDKSYRACICLGASTDTDDACGNLLHVCPDQDLLASLCDDVRAATELAALSGTHLQVPPAYSAVKKGGVTAYKAARGGKELELEPREVVVHRVGLVETGLKPSAVEGLEGRRLVCWDVEFDVSKGTYIRALARDLGRSLGCGAHLGALCRLSCGSMGLAQASTLEQLEAMGSDELALHFIDPVEALGLPSLELDEGQVAQVTNGAYLEAALFSAQVRPVPEVPGTAQDGVRHASRLLALTREGRLLALYTPGARPGMLVPKLVIPGGVMGVCCR